jgi:hypothetical protein
MLTNNDVCCQRELDRWVIYAPDLGILFEASVELFPTEDEIMSLIVLYIEAYNKGYEVCKWNRIYAN